MQYYVKDSTLIIDGDFEAVSTGLNGGRSHVKHLFNKQVPRTFNPPDPQEFLRKRKLWNSASKKLILASLQLLKWNTFRSSKTTT